MNPNTVFIKRKITDENSLPKKKGWYFVFMKGGSLDSMHFGMNYPELINDDCDYWLDHFSYWLEEVERPTDEEKDILINELKERLIEAKEIIRNWHGMEFPNDTIEKEMWRIYDAKSPEMKRINKTLEMVQTGLNQIYPYYEEVCCCPNTRKMWGCSTCDSEQKKYCWDRRL